MAKEVRSRDKQTLLNQQEGWELGMTERPLLLLGQGEWSQESRGWVRLPRKWAGIHTLALTISSSDIGVGEYCCRFSKRGRKSTRINSKQSKTPVENHYQIMRLHGNCLRGKGAKLVVIHVSSDLSVLIWHGARPHPDEQRIWRSYPRTGYPVAPIRLYY